MDARPRDGRLGSPSLVLLALAMAAAGASCAGGTGGTTGSGGSTGTGTGGASSSGGTTGTGGSNTGSGGTSSGTGGTNVGTGGVTGTGGSTSTGGTMGTGGTTGTGGSTSTGGATGTGGAAGAKGTGGTTGSGGASTGGATGSGGAAGTAGTGDCPSNATFCSGFETNALPPGAIYMANAAPGDWSRDFAVDTTQHHSGNSSLRVKSNGESGATGAYQMLAVPATPSAFWARFWMQSSLTIGQKDHNAYAGASVGSGTNDLMIEFAEDDGIAFNTKDSDCWPTVGCTGQQPTTQYTLPAMTWECIELSFDGANRVQQLYINGSLVINAPSYPSSTQTLPYFKFGLDGYHMLQRQLWYDDVVVAPTRIGGCQ